ncbi:MAG: hypothetical protein M3Z21_14265, partial [Pseudomonadota bacterium]|nr:hypothetical protein [Pseudomonadota bacterium]
FELHQISVETRTVEREVQRHRRQGRRRDALSARRTAKAAIALRRRVAVNLQAAGRQVNQFGVMSGIGAL